MIETLNGTHDAHTAILLLIIYVLDDEPQRTLDVVVGTEVSVYLGHFPEALSEVHATFLQDVAEGLIWSPFEAGRSSAEVEQLEVVSFLLPFWEDGEDVVAW